MANSNTSIHPPDESASPSYWLTVCQGMEAAVAFIQASDFEEVGIVLEKYPVLTLPQFPDAIAALGLMQGDQQMAKICVAKAGFLRSLPGRLSEQPSLLALAELMYRCAVLLIREARGNRRINLERAVEMFTSAGMAFSRDNRQFLACLLSEANVRTTLAELSVNTRINLETAIHLYGKARAIVPADSMDFAGFLMNEGTVRNRLADFRIDARENLEEALRLYDLARPFFPQGSLNAARCSMNEGTAHLVLAELGIDARANLEEALRLYDLARPFFAPNSLDAALCIMNQADARRAWAELGIDARANLEEALRLYGLAHSLLDRDSLEIPKCLVGESKVRSSLAKLGIDVRANLEEALRLCSLAHAVFPPDSPNAARCLVREGDARQRLADQSIDARANLEEALHLYGRARPLFAADSFDAAWCSVSEGDARQDLADQGIDARANLEEALHLYDRARAVFAPDSLDAARCLSHEGDTRLRLAMMGIDARANLEQALHLYGQARTIFPPDGRDAAFCLRDEGTAHEHLAEVDVDARANLEEALRLLGLARTIFLPNSLEAAGCLMNEGNVRQRLADRGIDARANLEEALRLHSLAHTILVPDNLEAIPNSLDAAMCLMNESNTRRKLAELDVDARANLEEALQLCSLARIISSTYSHTTAVCIQNEGIIHLRLAELGIDTQINLKVAMKLFQQSGDQLRELGSLRAAMQSYQSLGWLARECKQWEQARHGFEQAILMLEEVRNTALVMQDQYAWMENNLRLFKWMVEACLHLDNYERALEYIEKARSRTLADLLALADLTPQHVSTEQISAYRQMRQRLEELEALLTQQDGRLGGQLGSLDQEPRTLLFREKATIMQQLRVLEEELRQLDPDFFALATPLNLERMRELARRLARTLVLLWVGPAQGIAFLVRPSGEVAHIPLPEVTDALVQEWMLGPADDPAPSGWVGTYLRYRADEVDRQAWIDQIALTLAQIYMPLLQPVHSRLRDYGERRAAFVVAGALGLLPLHAAAWQDHGQIHHLLEELEIVYAPSAWVLKRCTEGTRSAWTPMLGVGNPQSTRPLPFSAWEMVRIAALVKKQQGPGSFTPLMGAAPTLKNVTELLPGHPVAHLSCHGEWNPQQPLQSALGLADGPLTLARLLGRLRLETTRLVVLSACDSGTGYPPGSSGEEYLGLPAGFLVAGAKAVIGSLWSVPDMPTALLMIHLYEHLLAGTEVSVAVQQAQLWMRTLKRADALALVEQAAPTLAALMSEDELKKYQDAYRKWFSKQGEHPFAPPYYWAAFTVLGSPGSIVSPMSTE